ncbi:hypothetical protein Tco_1223321 [Tanacetum coccineum]
MYQLTAFQEKDRRDGSDNGGIGAKAVEKCVRRPTKIDARRDARSYREVLNNVKSFEEGSVNVNKGMSQGEKRRAESECSLNQPNYDKLSDYLSKCVFGQVREVEGLDIVATRLEADGFEIEDVKWLPGYYPAFRTMWLNIVGVPVEGWFESTFKKIAEKWGRVLETSNCNLDVADILVTEKVLVQTSWGETIIERRFIKVNEVVITVHVEEDRYTLFAVEGNHHKDTSREDDNRVPSTLHEDKGQDCSDSEKSSEFEDYDDEGKEVEETQRCNSYNEKFSTNNPEINLNVDNIFLAKVDSGVPEQQLMEDSQEKVNEMSCREDLEVEESKFTDSVCRKSGGEKLKEEGGNIGNGKSTNDNVSFFKKIRAKNERCKASAGLSEQEPKKTKKESTPERVKITEKQIVDTNILEKSNTIGEDDDKPIFEDQYIGCDNSTRKGIIVAKGKKMTNKSSSTTIGGKLSMKIIVDRAKVKGKKKPVGVDASGKNKESIKVATNGRVSSSSILISSDDSARIREIRRKVGFVWKDKGEVGLSQDNI